MEMSDSEGTGHVDVITKSVIISDQHETYTYSSTCHVATKECEYVRYKTHRSRFRFLE